MNTKRALRRIGKGAAVGVGSIGANRLHTEVSNRQSMSQYVPALVGLGVGAGASIGADYVLPNDEGLMNDAVEYVGYGVQGESWQNGFNKVTASQNTSASGEVIEVTANANSRDSEETEDEATSLYSVDA